MLQLGFFLVQSISVKTKPDWHWVLRVIQGNRAVSVYISLILAVHRLHKLKAQNPQPYLTRQRQEILSMFFFLFGIPIAYTFKLITTRYVNYELMKSKSLFHLGFM